MQKILRAAALCAAVSVAAPAMAAPIGAVPPATGRALILTPLTLNKLQDLHFGTIIPSAVPGTVTVPADGSAATVAGGVSLVPSDPTVVARFAGAGSPNQDVILAVTNPGTLSDGLGNTVTVVSLDLDGPNTRTIDASRAFFFNVGGTIAIAADQVEGVYSSDFDVTADYQ